MGVDAEMFVRHKGAPLGETEIRQLAARMCATLGHERFLILRPGEFTWESAGRHALSLCPTVAEKRAEYQTDYSGAPEYYEGVLRALNDVEDSRHVWTQDGPDIIGDPGEQFIRVHLWTRYYGPGYERGDWSIIRATAEFLEAAIPGCEVWYGGDSSGVCAAPLGEAERATMTAYWLSKGHENYRAAFGSFRRSVSESCDFCGGKPMHDCGGGQGETFWHCDGCGLKRVTGPGTSRDLAKGVDFFDRHKS